MASTKVLLRTSKILKNGEHPIVLRVIKDRKTKFLFTGLSCSADLWDFKENKPKKKHPNRLKLELFIDKKKVEAQNIILDLENEIEDYTTEHFKRAYKVSTKKVKVFKYFDETIERLEKAGRIGYANIFQSTKNSLVNFLGKDELEFSEITPGFLSKYEEGFLERGVSLNSIFVFMRTLKTLLNYARKENIIKESFNPFKEISFTKYRRVKTKKRAITKEQIKDIAALELESETSLFHAKNYFLFSFYNRGINFIDMAFLKWENIKADRLTYTRKKTKEQFTIGMLAPAIDIVKYYKKIYYDGEGSYVFPILNETHKTAKSIDYRIDRMLKIVNSDLKTIAEKAKIDEKLTTYVARHSFATIMKRSGVSTAMISESMGHESEKTTQIYLDSFESKVLDEASKALL